MRYKKLLAFFVALVLFLSIFVFLLAYEESPLNRYFREEEARNWYNEALEFYESKNYESAIDILENKIDTNLGFWGGLRGTETAKKGNFEAILRKPRLDRVPL
jgi:hypothetical protein